MASELNAFLVFFWKFLLCTDIINTFELPQFPNGSPWTLDISASTDIHPNSSQITSWLESQGGFGNNRFQIDWSIIVLSVNCTNSIHVSFTPSPNYYFPDCDNITSLPLPFIGSIEGHNDWNSSQKCPDGDCHLLIYDTDSGLLYESFYTSIIEYNQQLNMPSKLTSQCVVIWNTSYLYPANQRGDGCTSADAAGFPISSLLFTADEIAAGSIDHAIRFILPNSRMRAGYYIHPASHYGGPTSHNNHAPIYGSRWRLKSDLNITKYSESNAGQVILRALKKYGMFLSDGGNIALTAMSDKFSTDTTYDALGFGTWDIKDVKPSDFEIMNGFESNPLIGHGLPDCGTNLNDIPVNTDFECTQTDAPQKALTNYPTDNPVVNPTISPQEVATTTMDSQETDSVNIHTFNVIIIFWLIYVLFFA
eukprot:76291_1